MSRHLLITVNLDEFGNGDVQVRKTLDETLQGLCYLSDVAPSDAYSITESQERATALRERAHRLTSEADEAARDPDRQDEIHQLLEEAEREARRSELEGEGR